MYSNLNGLKTTKMNKAQKLLIKARCNDLVIGTNEDGTDLYVSDIMLYYHREQGKKLNIDDVSKLFYCQTERGCTKQCDECALIELNPPF